MENLNMEKSLGGIERQQKPEDVLIGSFAPLGESTPPVYMPTFSGTIEMQNGTPSCFIAGTKILMANGSYKNIEDITKGEEVIDAYGNSQIVIQKINRHWQGRLYEIKAFGHLPIIATPEHPFLTSDGNFITAENLTSKHYLIPTVNKVIKDKTDWYFETNPDFLLLLGWYLAEGFAQSEKGRHRVCFTLCDDEEQEAQFISDTIFNIWGVRATKKKNNEHHRIDITVNRMNVARIFMELGKVHCENKEIHNKFMLLDPKLQLEIARGWFKGDGTKKNRRITGTTTSEILAYQMYFILLRNGILPSIRTEEPKNKKKIYRIEIAGKYCNILYPEMSSELLRKSDTWRGVSDSKEITRRIKSIKKIKAQRGNLYTVYNLEVTGSHTYSVNGLGVHNCGGHAGASMKNILDTPFRGSPEYLWKRMRLMDKLSPDEGSNMLTIMQTLSKSGIAPYSDLPNNASVSNSVYADPSTLTAQMDIDAAEHKIDTYAFSWNPTFQQIKDAIYTHGHALLLMRIGAEWWRDKTNTFSTWQEKDILPLRTDIPISSGHFVTAYAFDETYIYFVNSWSLSWGRAGIGYFAEDYASRVVEMGTSLNLKAVKYVFTKTLKLGSKGFDVKQLQKVLGVTEDGIFGPNTQNAVKLFQEAHNLSQDGVVGPITNKALNSL